MNTHYTNSKISLDVVRELLELEGQELLEATALTLHKALNTHCTSMIERATSKGTMSPVVIAQSNKSQCEQNIGCSCYRPQSNTTNLSCLSAHSILHSLPDDALTHEITSPYLIAIPTRTQNGQVMGVLFSSYASPLNSEQQQEHVKQHKLFANIIIHTLREMWFNKRSEQLVSQLSYEVSHDSLTGLLNRSCLTDTLESLSQQNGLPFSLTFLDIDSFKEINDIYGNYIGDKVLQNVANILRKFAPEPHLTFRTAGDEFAYITHNDDPIKIAEEIQQKIEQGYSGSVLKVNTQVNIGLARSQGKVSDVEQIIYNASLALKDCKQTPNLHIRCYDTNLSETYRRKSDLIAELRSELNHPLSPSSELYVVAQPIVHCLHANWDYFEILARWQSKKYGLVSPVEFIQVAEESGLIVELGERIIELACLAKSTLEQGLGYKVKVGINCSAHELTDSARYLRYLSDTLSRYHFDPNEFVIELTETVLLLPTLEIKQALVHLRAQGFSIALDDFGTGYSSLNYIQSYPIDCIKVDATFTQNLLTNPTAESVVWLITQLAHRLGVALVAEGVETQAELDKLHSMGCEMIQGYYYSRPQRPADLIEGLVEKKRALAG